MMKILQIIHGLNTGGAETLVKEYSININKKKFDLKVICFDRLYSPYEKILEQYNVPVVYLSDLINIKRNNLFFKIIYKIKFCRLLRKVIRNEKPDIIHTHLNINYYIRKIKLDKNIKIFHTVHSEPRILWNKNNIRKRIDFLAAKWLVKNRNMRFIVLHNDMKNEINKLFKINNSIVLNNGIDFNRFSKVKNRELLCSELGIPKDSYIIGHIGRFTPSKNHLFIIDVFKKIQESNNKSFLLLIGSGPIKVDIENKLNELKLNEHYIILENRIDIPDLINIMDCFIFPSLYEGLGIVLIEAQKMKVPCFKSDKVPNYAVISNLVTTISLMEGADIWAKKILNYKYPREVKISDKDWDIKEVVKKLEKIYENKI